MEIKKRLNSSLKRNEVKYFTNIYDKVLSEIVIDQNCEKQEILRNKRALKNLCNKYPFIVELIEVLNDIDDDSYKRKIIVDEIINFLTLIYQTENYKVKDGNCIYELKKYIKVKENLSYDLNQILKEIGIFHFLNSTNEKELSVKETTNINSLSKLKTSLMNCKLFDSETNSFKLQEYGDITSLQSFQYLMCYYIFEMLGKNITEVNNMEIYSYFNQSFSIIRRGQKQEMNTRNWNTFKSDKLDSIDDCQFYVDLCKELKKVTELPTKPSKQS